MPQGPRELWRMWLAIGIVAGLACAAIRAGSDDARRTVSLLIATLIGYILLGGFAPSEPDNGRKRSP